MRQQLENIRRGLWVENRLNNSDAMVVIPICQIKNRKKKFNRATASTGSSFFL